MLSPEGDIRPARAPETTALHDLWLAAPDRRDWTPAEGPGAPLLAELDVLVAEKRVWAAFKDGQPIAVAAAGEIDSALFLTMLGVAEDWRGCGYGHALLQTVRNFGSVANYPAIYALASRLGPGFGFLRRNSFVTLDEDRLTPGFAALLKDAGGPHRCAVLALPL
ncbi:MAG: hypothetical protein C0606_07980 [Hyphomicrobiales bacterium]|nr:MAG: hypothetical protein C0606_07980 [Hyphomicrobiales bacterium]